MRKLRTLGHQRQSSVCVLLFSPPLPDRLGNWDPALGTGRSQNFSDDVAEVLHVGKVEV